MYEIKKLTAWFRAQVGTAENPLGSNNERYNTAYYGREVFGDNYPWCATTIWTGYKECDLSKRYLDGGRTAYCPYIASWAQSHGCWVTGGYREGDILLYALGGNQINHVGYCASANGKTVESIEGNYSDKVCDVRRSVSEVVGAYRPTYAADISTKPETTPTMPDEDKPTDVNNGIAKGDIVSIVPGATYWTGQSIPAWVQGMEWRVRSIYNGRAVLGRSADGTYNVNSPVSAKYLIKAANPQPEQPHDTITPKEYIVERGDTLWGIAEHYMGNGARYKELMKANNLKTTNIYPGQQLIIPEKRGPYD